MQIHVRDELDFIQKTELGALKVLNLQGSNTTSSCHSNIVALVWMIQRNLKICIDSMPPCH